MIDGVAQKYRILGEHRFALVTAAVTGRIDVRDLA